MTKPNYISIKDGMSAGERFITRLLDILVSGICLVVFSPLFLYCYIAIRRCDGGTALFRQERIGRGGRPFFIYKFRTMNPNAEAEGPQLFAGDDCDARLTPIGRTLRKHHLDELPQLWNVFVVLH